MRANIRQTKAVAEKQCTKCHRWLAAERSSFPPFKQGQMGLHPWCRECVRDYKRKNQATHGRPVRKIQAAPGSSARAKLPKTPEVRAFIEQVTKQLEKDGSRFKAYLIRNEATEECYIGITERDLGARWKQHIASAVKGDGYFLHERMRQYGIGNFSFHHLASAKDRAALHELEQLLIEQFDTVERGYNQTRGGASGESIGNRIEIDNLTFISMNAAARHFGVPEHSIHQRIKRYGWSVEEAVEVKKHARKTHKVGSGFEVNGCGFDSFRAACKFHGLEESAVRSRLKIGWPKLQAFGLQPRSKRKASNARSVTVAGVKYDSITSAALARAISARLVQSRIRSGWTLEQAFGLERPPAHKKPGVWVQFGKTAFCSVAAACRAYAKDPAVVSARLRSGWSIDQALDFVAPPPPSGEKNGREITIRGITFSSRAKAARAYGVDPRVVHKRLALGWSIAQSFGLEPPPREERG